MNKFSSAVGLAAVLTATAVMGCQVATAAAPAPDAPQQAADASGWTLPPVNGVFDYQIGGAYTPRAGTGIVDRDHSEQPVAGLYNVCYINAFQTQPGDKKFWTKQHLDLLVQKKGKPVEDPEWPDEFLLDTSTEAKRAALLEIVGPWIDGCAAAGFDAIEPDNLDSFTRSNKISRTNNLAFAKLLADRSHNDALAFAQKNTSELTQSQREEVGFDFAIAEECEYNDQECGEYTSTYGSHVIEIEYTDNGTEYYDAACDARGSSISIILRDRDVVARGEDDYEYASC